METVLACCNFSVFRPGRHIMQLQLLRSNGTELELLGRLQ